MPDSPIKPQSSSDSKPNTHCFVCGPDNAIGLRLSFQLEGDFCRTEFVPDVRHQGYDGWLHGGILAAVLDDVMANWFYMRGIKAVTGKMEIRYRAPVPIGSHLKAESWLTERRGGLGMLRCKAVNGSGDVLAEATGTYRIMESNKGSPEPSSSEG